MSTAVVRARRFVDRPWVAHLLRANQRFNSRLGSQFGAAITYFSVLAVVPILLFAFSVVGFVLTVVDPAGMDFVLTQVRSALSGFGLTGSSSRVLLNFIEESLRHWAAPGIVGLLSAMYSGAGWAGNLKSAVRAQTVDDFDAGINSGENIVIKTLKNFGVLIGLLVSIVVTFAIATVSTTLSTTIVDWIGLDQVGWLKPVLQIVPIFISIGAGWLVFMYLFLVLPEEREQWPALRRGALIGAVGLGVLQYGATLLLQLLGKNKAIAVFGPLVLVMLFLNLFARLILFCAAWIDTWEEPALEARTSSAPGEFPPENRARRAAAQSRARGDRGPDDHGPDGADDTEGSRSDPDAPPRNITTPGTPVPEKVALRASRLSLGVGWFTGTATGVGIGALLAMLTGRIAGRDRR